MNEGVDSLEPPDYARLVTSESVLKSIENAEIWWRELKDIMSSGRAQEINDFVSRAITLYENLERLANNPLSQLPKTPEEAQQIKALWIISAPGTYFEGRKNDRYKDKQWALWADRQRINYAFGVARKIAEVKSGRKIEGNLPAEMEALTQYAPLVVYNGRPDENAALTEAVDVPWLRIPEGLGYPKDQVYIINPLTNPRFNNEQYSLLDQISSFHLPRNFKLDDEDIIGVIAHAPQAVRLLYSLNASPEAFPAGVKVKVLPLPTPKSGIPEYPIQEIRGTIYNHFIVNPPAAAAVAYPHVL